jgi:hypothetical protein
MAAPVTMAALGITDRMSEPMIVDTKEDMGTHLKKNWIERGFRSSPMGGSASVSAETAGYQQDLVMKGLMSKIFEVNEAPALGDLQASGPESGEMAPGPAETEP